MNVDKVNAYALRFFHAVGDIANEADPDDFNPMDVAIAAAGLLKRLSADLGVEPEKVLAAVESIEVRRVQ